MSVPRSSPTPEGMLIKFIDDIEEVKFKSRELPLSPGRYTLCSLIKVITDFNAQIPYFQRHLPLNFSYLFRNRKLIRNNCHDTHLIASAFESLWEGICIAFDESKRIMIRKIATADTLSRSFTKMLIWVERMFDDVFNNTVKIRVLGEDIVNDISKHTRFLRDWTQMTYRKQLESMRSMKEILGEIPLDDCGICMDRPLNESTSIAILEGCSHIFCNRCFKKWNRINRWGCLVSIFSKQSKLSK